MLIKESIDFSGMEKALDFIDHFVMQTLSIARSA